MRNGLDRIDLKILSALQMNARMSNLALSKHVNMSPSACLARVQSLRNYGYIEKNISVISIAKLGPVLYSVIEVIIDSHHRNTIAKFESAIAEMDEIVFSVLVSGRFDYLLITTTVDMQHLSRLSDKMLDGDLGISKLVTSPVLDITKPFSGFPLNILSEAHSAKLNPA